MVLHVVVYLVAWLVLSVAGSLAR